MLSAGMALADSRQGMCCLARVWCFVLVLPHLLIEMLLCPGQLCCCVCLAPGAYSCEWYVLTGATSSGPSGAKLESEAWGILCLVLCWVLKRLLFCWVMEQGRCSLPRALPGLQLLALCSSEHPANGPDACELQC